MNNVDKTINSLCSWIEKKVNERMNEAELVALPHVITATAELIKAIR